MLCRRVAGGAENSIIYLYYLYVRAMYSRLLLASADAAQIQFE